MKQLSRVCEKLPRIHLRLEFASIGPQKVLRCMVTSSPYSPLAAETYSLLQQLGSDPLYTKLCKVQESFRARVSPKFWRCGGMEPPSRYPFFDHVLERRYRDWEQRYERIADNYSTCVLIGSFGNPNIHPRDRNDDANPRQTVMPGRFSIGMTLRHSFLIKFY